MKDFFRSFKLLLQSTFRLWYTRWSRVVRSSWETFWKRSTLPIRKRHLRVLRSLSESYLEQKTWEGWKLSPDQLRALRSLRNSQGWRIYSGQLKRLGMEMLEYLSVAESQQELFRRQGSLQTWLRIYSLVDSLDEVNTTPMEEYIRKQMEAGYEELKRTNPELAELIMKG